MCVDLSAIRKLPVKGVSITCNSISIYYMTITSMSLSRKTSEYQAPPSRSWTDTNRHYLGNGQAFRLLCEPIYLRSPGSRSLANTSTWLSQRISLMSKTLAKIEPTQMLNSISVIHWLIWNQKWDATPFGPGNSLWTSTFNKQREDPQIKKQHRKLNQIFSQFTHHPCGAIQLY